VGCAATVRSALLSVKGVTRAKVTLENREALVTYDPAEATIDDLIKAVNSADGGPFSYTATLKKPARKRSR
jgi:copper chaperone CopZ